jgi:hypothetical protein
MKVEKLEIKQKAWRLNLDMIDEGYLCCKVIVYANTRNGAKSEILKEMRHEEYKLAYSVSDVTYTNVPILRAESYDKLLFEGVELTRQGIDSILKDRERKDKLYDILNDPNISHCYIRKGNYYRPNSCGYTDFIHRAGVYTKEEAVKHANGCSDLTIIPIDPVVHNGILNKEIEDIKSRLIGSGLAIPITN